MNNLISRQAAIDAINELHDKPNAWLDLAVARLEELPSAQPEIANQTEESAQNVPNGELISKKAAIEALEKMSANYGKIGRREWHPHIEECKAELSMLPSAQPTEASCWGCNCQKMERLKEQKTFSEMVHLHDAERREE